MTALDKQVAGDHYKKLKIQPIEYIHANNIPFAEGCAIKYLTRWRDKGGIADLEKAKHHRVVDRTGEENGLTRKQIVWRLRLTRTLVYSSRVHAAVPIACSDPKELVFFASSSAGVQRTREHDRLRVTRLRCSWWTRWTLAGLS